MYYYYTHWESKPIGWHNCKIKTATERARERKQKTREKNSSIIRHTSMVLNGCAVITIEMFCIRLILWLWMKWCGLTTTKYHFTQIYSPVNWIYFYQFFFLLPLPLLLLLLSESTELGCLQQLSYMEQVILILVLKFELVCVHWLHMTATGDWLREIFKNSVVLAPLQFSPKQWSRANNTKSAALNCLIIVIYLNVISVRSPCCKHGSEKKWEIFLGRSVHNRHKKLFVLVIMHRSINLWSPIRRGVLASSLKTLHVFPSRNMR